MLSSLVLHVHPTRVRVHVLKLKSTLGLGLISFYLFGILTVTGLVLMLYYVPHTGAAYRSMKDIEFAVTFGMFLRNAHRWAAHGMVALVFLHMCRVFFTGSYKRPREFNWVVGVGLLVLTLALSFTGYLLPWDQLAFWAITVGTSIVSYFPLVGDPARYLLLGGHEIGQAALLRFYVLHCVVLPLIMGFLIGVHFWRVRKDGGLAVPPGPHAPCTDVAAPALPGAPRPPPRPGGGARRGAPGGRAARGDRQRGATPNPAKAPWYFLGLQELVHYGAVFGGVVVPTALLLALVALPYVDRRGGGVGVWFARERRVANAVFGVVALAVVVLTLVGTFFRGPNWDWVWPWVR